MASARFGKMFSCFRSVSVSQRMSFKLLAVSGRITVSTVPDARATPFFFRVTGTTAELRFVRSAIFPFDFFIGHSSFDFSVKIHCQQERFGKCAELFRSVFPVILTFPGFVLRPPAILDVQMHTLLPVLCCGFAIVGLLEIGLLFCLDGLKILGAVFDIVESLFFFALSRRLGKTTAKAGTSAVAVEVKSASARTIDVA